MSTRVMDRCWSLVMPPPAKAVYVSLADQANDHGVCWPAVATLTERTCLSERTVQRSLRWLEDHGALTVEVRIARSGRMTSNSYLMTPEKYQAPPPQGDEGTESEPAAEGSLRGVTLTPEP